MQIEELGLNRFLYKTANGIGSDSSLFSPGSSGADGAGGGLGPATSVASGTIITSCILQSSPSDNRIEINPDDTFRAYRNRQVVVQIDRNGITLAGASFFNYEGQDQPVMYTGNVNAAGTLTDGPSGWTSSFIFLGFYRIVHNLGLAAPYMKVVVTTQNGYRLIADVVSNTNYFDVSFIDDGGVTQQGDFTFFAARYLP